MQGTLTILVRSPELVLIPKGFITLSWRRRHRNRWDKQLFYSPWCWGSLTYGEGGFGEGLNQLVYQPYKRELHLPGPYRGKIERGEQRQPPDAEDHC
jgi:hypothetical protein